LVLKAVASKDIVRHNVRYFISNSAPLGANYVKVVEHRLIFSDKNVQRIYQASTKPMTCGDIVRGF